VSGVEEVPAVDRVITRIGLETQVALTCNSAGAAVGLSPLAWRLGDAWDGVDLVGDADAHATELRQDIIESWIAALGLADEVTLLDEPLQRSGASMIWTGTMDGITYQLSCPTPDDVS
jgi:hypothetical protein